MQAAEALTPIDFEVAPKKVGGAFRTISEVAEELNVQQHVLRFWETKFNQIRPMKRGGGRRYYRPEDVSLLKHIHHLLYAQGYTIKGAQKLLKGQSRTAIVQASVASDIAQTAQIAAERSATVVTAPVFRADDVVVAQPVQAALAAPQADLVSALEGMLSDLKALRGMIAQGA